MRTTNRILSSLLGLVLIVVGLAVAIEMALIAAGRNPWCCHSTAGTGRCAR
jgi:hypothetical protein